MTKCAPKNVSAFENCFCSAKNGQNQNYLGNAKSCYPEILGPDQTESNLNSIQEVMTKSQLGILCLFPGSASTTSTTSSSSSTTSLTSTEWTWVKELKSLGYGDSFDTLQLLSDVFMVSPSD